MKMRKGWVVVWPDGTEWRGDCPVWARQSTAPGVVVKPTRILGVGRWPCPGCTTGKH